MSLIKQSTSVNKAYFLGPGLTTVTVSGLSKAGGGFSSPHDGVVTSIGNGWYSVSWDTVDTNTIGDFAADFAAVIGAPVDPPADQVVLDLPGSNLPSAYDAAKTAAQAGDAMTLTVAYNAAKTAAQAGDAMTLTGAYDDAKTASQAGDAMTLTSAYDSAKTASQAADLIIHKGQAVSGTSTTIVLDAGAVGSGADDFYKGAWIWIKSGQCTGQTRLITAYNSLTKTVTVSPAWLVSVPDSNSFFTITPAADVGISGSSLGDVTLAATQPNYAPAKAGDAMTLANGAITEAKITLPSEPSTLATGALSKLMQIWNRLFRRSHDDKVGGSVKTYAANGTTVVTTQAYTNDGTATDLGAAS